MTTRTPPKRRTRAAPPPPRVPWRPILAVSAALLLTLAACVAALGGYFTVTRVQVVGTGLPQAAIVQAADVTGKNIFRIRTDALVDQLDTRVPSIAVTRVETALPDTVTIYAQERHPIVAWQRGASLVLVDPSGWVIGPVKSTTLPIISGSDTAQRIAPSTIEAVTYAVSALPATGPDAVASFQMESSTGLIIVGRGGWQADVGAGTARTLLNRIATLHSILDTVRAGGRRLQFVDLRYRVPYLKYAGA